MWPHRNLPGPLGRRPLVDNGGQTTAVSLPSTNLLRLPAESAAQLGRVAQGLP
jgi:hypothetical protein